MTNDAINQLFGLLTEKETLVNKIHSLAMLKTDWYGEGSSAPIKQSVEEAINFALKK